jgi:hypothetical protein
MSSRSPSPTDSVITHKHTVIIASQVTHHTVIPVKQGSKAKPKDKKEVKTKELSHSFLPTVDNYVSLLKAILSKHGEEKYNITEKKRYVFKVLCPPAKAFASIILTLFIWTNTYYITEKTKHSILTTLRNTRSLLAILSGGSLPKSRSMLIWPISRKPGAPLVFYLYNT